MDKKLLAIVNTAIKFDASFTSRIQPLEDTFHIIKIKRKHSTCSVTIKEPSIRLITIQESIFKKLDERNSCRAQVRVIVLTSPITDVNFYRCLKHVQVIHPKCYPVSTERISKQTCIAEENNSKQEITNEINCLSDQLPPWKVTTDEALSKSDEFLLSDHSLLEKYVKYKRDKLERLRSEPMEFDSRESSCSLAASELMRACAVRILEPTRQKPYITAPSRSRLGSVEMETISTPIQKTSLAGSTKMLDLLSYGEQLLATSYHGLQSSPAITTERSMSLTKHSFEFDPPMSPFEQRLQNQAFQLRRISNISNCDSPAIQVKLIAYQQYQQ
ncbi:unnamed protein product [Onchocerca flexuosa]|uniref:PID domain-containing protein n=1 Tax=Onchocerca flexuosa TaxID=387005 RepID=A0A183I4N7_9BILA|nr:unnamed protein product [Onchocerca flexuosa]